MSTFTVDARKGSRLLKLRLDVSFKTMMMTMLVEIGAHFSGQGRALGNERKRSDWSRQHSMPCRYSTASSLCRFSCTRGLVLRRLTVAGFCS